MLNILNYYWMNLGNFGNYVPVVPHNSSELTNTLFDNFFFLRVFNQAENYNFDFASPLNRKIDSNYQILQGFPNLDTHFGFSNPVKEDGMWAISDYSMIPVKINYQWSSLNFSIDTTLDSSMVHAKAFIEIVINGKLVTTIPWDLQTDKVYTLLNDFNCKESIITFCFRFINHIEWSEPARKLSIMLKSFNVTLV